MTLSEDFHSKLKNWLDWQQEIEPFFFGGRFLGDLNKTLEDALKTLYPEPDITPLLNAGAETAAKPTEEKPLSAAVNAYKYDPSLSPVENLRREVSQCTGCQLAKCRTSTVFGEGNLNADIMFIGEGPGETEDKTGRPFVGDAGQLLTKIIENGMKIPRDSVYIANIVKCRPPRNRDPFPDEAASCIGYLKKQIEIVNPKVIVLLGRVATRYILGLDTTLSAARGTSHEYNGIKTFVTYHPSALLRNENLKRPTWEDIKKVMKFLAEAQ